MKYTAAEINKALKTNLAGKIDEDEKRYADEVIKLANVIAENEDNKIVLLSGPSGAGKTTTAHILEELLESRNIDTCIISLDNFYKGPGNMPLLASGEPDYESIYSLDLEEIHRCFIRLIKSGDCELPIFDFMVGARSDETHHVHLRTGGIAIVEGIHALNPLITDTLPTENLFKIYISIKSTYIDNDGNELLSGRDLRLIRRLSRDFIYRNSSAVNTLRMWDGVIHGEEKYLFPHKNSADYTVDTLHCYEPAMFKSELLKILSDVPETNTNYRHIDDVVRALEMFIEIKRSNVPKNSLLREFI